MSNDNAVSRITTIAEQLDVPTLYETRAALDRIIKERSKHARRQAREEAKEIARKYGLNLADVIGEQPKRGKGGGGGKVPPKYRHPEDPSKTWAGRGRKPAWVRDWEANGGSLDALRIPDGEADVEEAA